MACPAAPLPEIVDGADHHAAPGFFIHRDADIAEVGVRYVMQVGRRPGRVNADKRFIAIGLGVHLANGTFRYAGVHPEINGFQNAAFNRD